jgi:hypothetical protein
MDFVIALKKIIKILTGADQLIK